MVVRCWSWDGSVGCSEPLGDDNQQFEDGSSGASRDITLGLLRRTFGLEAWAPVEPHGCSVLELECDHRWETTTNNLRTEARVHLRASLWVFFGALLDLKLGQQWNRMVVRCWSWDNHFAGAKNAVCTPPTSPRGTQRALAVVPVWSGLLSGEWLCCFLPPKCNFFV